MAASPEMERVLKKETISSASDSSSIDDVRSPRSPDSVNSYRDDEKCLDEDLHQSNSRSGSFSSRRMSSGMPKSPDGKLSSPRLCLKFHRDHIGHQKTRDTTYSVTNMSVSDTDPMFSPDDSPASSVDSSDLLGFSQAGHVTHFSGHRVKITMPEEESLDFDMRQKLMVPNLNSSDFSSTKEICPEKDLNENSRNSDLLPFLSNVKTFDKQGGINSLRTFGTLPFKPSSQPLFGDINSHSEDSLELPDLEIDTSNSRVNSIHKPDTPDIHLTNSHSEHESVSSSALDVTNQSSVSSTTTAEQRSTFGTPPQVMNLENTVVCSQSVTSSSVSPTVSTSSDVINTSNVLSSSSPSLTNTTPSSSSVTTVCSMESSTVVNDSVKSESQVQVKSEVTSPCSPRTDRDSRDSRPSSPKVPPLKIIIPPKSQASSTSPEASDRLKLVANVKSALPYVIRPYQNQSGENDTTNEIPAELKHTNNVQISVNSHPPISNQVTTNSVDLKLFNSLNCDSFKTKTSIGSVNDRNGVMKEVSENIPMDIDACDTNSAPVDNTSETMNPVQDNNVDDSMSESGRCDSKSQTENNGRKGDAPQRVLRSTVRSQQLSSTETRPTKPPKPQEKPTERPPDKVEKNNGVDSSLSPSESPITMLNNSRPVREDEEICIHPRKRKLKRSDCEHPDSPDLYSCSGSTEKIPNPYEIYLSLRKKIGSRRQGYLDMVSICPKTPQGFKDYLLMTCSYVLQGNNSSMLSVPTLSPPNSVKDKMRDLFVTQEESRYKLRLQHLIEREKLMLSIEQEILREHGRWACVLANQGTPLSVCTVLRDEEIYNFMEDQVRLEEKDKKNRTRYNGRQFLSWIQDVDDKYEKIKELLILRQKQEADSLWAYQKLEWEWRMKELKLCERNATPDIDDIHVPLVTVYDNFELRPT